MILLFYVTQGSTQCLFRKIMSFVNICNVINFERTSIVNELNFDVMIQLEENLIE